MDCWIRFITIRVVRSTLVLYSDHLRNQVKFIQVLKESFSNVLLFQILALLQVAFLELLQDITKVYQDGWKKRLKPSFILW